MRSSSPDFNNCWEMYFNNEIGAPDLSEISVSEIFPVKYVSTFNKNVDE